ncbi:MAG: cytochrome b/b6 domain-containing protein, partial [Betaproteobacteria bacterium]|nr:cytochrome b/b6 domain-containing protein [Betaproteobacteria bacterium]
AMCVVALFVTGKLGGNWMEWHKKAGYFALGLVLFRVFWGFAGSETARFTQFVRGPRAVIDYLQGRWSAVPGHNPLGALSVVAMLLALLFQAASGLFANDDILLEGPLYALVSKETSDFITKLHQWNSDLIIGLIVLHLAAIVWYTAIKKETLIGPMINGGKAAGDHVEPRMARGWTALIWMAVAAAIVWAVVNRLWR